MSENRFAPEDVRQLEEQCEAALVDIVADFLGRQPGRNTCHLMAKAAVTVLEAALDQADV